MSLEKEADVMGLKAMQLNSGRDANLPRKFNFIGTREVIQMFPFGKKKAKSEENVALLGSNYQQSDADSTQLQDSSTKEKLIAIGTQLRTYYDIHLNYRKYEQALHGKPWRLLNKGWGFVNKILAVIEKIDTSGITAVVHQVSKLLQKLFSIMSELNALKDNLLREQLTPLLSHSLDLDTIKNAFKEAKSLVNQVKSTVEAIEEII